MLNRIYIYEVKHPCAIFIQLFYISFRGLFTWGLLAFNWVQGSKFHYNGFRAYKLSTNYMSPSSSSTSTSKVDKVLHVLKQAKHCFAHAAYITWHSFYSTELAFGTISMEYLLKTSCRLYSYVTSQKCLLKVSYLLPKSCKNRLCFICGQL